MGGCQPEGWRTFRVGAGSPEIRSAPCRTSACPVAHGAVATVEMGVPLAFLG